MEEALKNQYYKIGASPNGAKALFQAVKNQGIKMKEVKSFLLRQEAYQLTKKVDVKKKKVVAEK